MDTSRISNSGFFSDKSMDSIKKSEAKKTDPKDTKNVSASPEEGELSGLLKLPPHKIVAKLSELLEKAPKDPKTEKLLTQLQISSNSKQAIALTTFTCLKELFGNRFSLTSEEEKQVIAALVEEFEEDASAQSLDPDERKKKQQKNKEKRKERRSKSKPKINAVISLVEECMKNLAKKHSSISFQS